MRLSTTSCLVAGLALLAGCQRGTGSNNMAASNNAVPYSSVAPVNRAAPLGSGAPLNVVAPAPDGQPVTHDFVVGRWGINGFCEMGVEYRDGGEYQPPDGATWTLVGDILSVSSPDGRVVRSRANRAGPDTMTLVDPSGEGPVQTLTRCQLGNR